MATFLDPTSSLKIIVAGSRSFSDYSLLEHWLCRLTANIQKPLIVVSGGAKGADKLGEKWAWEKGPRPITVMHFFPDWEKYGRSAGVRRNQEMVDFADRAVIFWDGKSPGTADLLRRARSKGMKLKAIRFEVRDGDQGEGEG